MDQKVFQYALTQRLNQYKDRTAVEYKDRKVTYEELERNTNIIANRLIAGGIQKETLVGILMDDRQKIIEAVIGILKAGAVFVPLDPAHPAERQNAMQETVGIRHILCDNANKERQNPADGTEVQVIEDILSGTDKEPELTGPPPVQYGEEDKIYIYFTSGTTGTPKAIQGKNKSLWHFINWEVETFGIDETIRGSQFTVPTFDAFLRDVFVPLFAGGVVCIPEPDVMRDADRLVRWIDDAGVRLIHSVPSLFRFIKSGNITPDHFRELKYIMLSGERINPSDLPDWYETFGERVQLVNYYGSTETTMIKSYYKIQESDRHKERIPIGKPMKGARLMVCDEKLNICDELITGEIYVRTPYRTHGYYNDDELNKERFIPNPYTGNPTDLLYKTGDLGRLLPDGNHELMGRVDRQVKIMGVRIELEEIENALLSHPQVNEAVVAPKSLPNGTDMLVAWVTAAGGTEQAGDGFIAAVKQHLTQKLPDTMQPAKYTAINDIPRKPNGKVDYAALLEGLKDEEADAGTPRDKWEEKLAEIWSEILGCENIGIHTGFFELGGNSLNVMTLLTKIHMEYDARIPLGEIFENSTIAKQAAIVREANQDIFASIGKAEPKPHYPLSPMQKRLYVLDRMAPNNIAYNIPQGVRLVGELDRERLEATLKKLIERHESFRTAFKEVNRQPVQEICEDVPFELEYHEAQDTTGGAVIERFIRPFDLSRPPLLRTALIKLEDNSHILMTDMHHIISDAYSQSIIIKDFAAIYNGDEPTPLKLQYKDFSQWQNEDKQKENIQQQKNYWVEKYGGEVPVLNIPGDYHRPAVQDFAGSTVAFELGKEETAALNGQATEEGTTLYNVLLTVFNIWLSKLSGQEDIVIGTPTAGRGHVDLENIIGMFVNTLALRNRVDSRKTYHQQLHEIKKNAVEAFENQDYPFEELVDQLSLNRDVSRNPLFDVVFAHHNIGAAETEISGITLLPNEYENKTAKFDLTMRTSENAGKLTVKLEYRTKLFKKETIRRYIGYYKEIVSSILQDPAKAISDIELITEEEKKRLLYLYNETAAARYPEDKSLHRLFEDRTRRTPNAIAVQSAPGVGTRLIASATPASITYNELNDESNRLAAQLIEKGVNGETIVAMIMERTVEMIVGILAILKAGGAYLPITPETPEARINYILSDSGAPVLLTTEETRQKAETVKTGAEIITVTRQNDQNIEVTPVTRQQSPTAAAYIIYTSGTTGNPKGVMIEHRNVVRLMVNDKHDFDFDENDTWTMFHSYSFDFSVWEMYGALLYGGRLVLIDKITARDPGAYLDLLARESVTVLNQTPSAFYNLANEELKYPEKRLNLRTVIFGGEALQPGKLRNWKNKYPETKLINMYGITETTVHVTVKEITEEEIDTNISNIGKPIPTTSVNVMDTEMRLQPVGIPGELCVGGDGLARGYLNQPELTAEKFVQNPYIPGQRLYKSGDQAKILENGEMEYHGRIDHQVKIRGYRIELGEIEYRLSTHDKIKEVVVTAGEDENGNKYISAYYESDNETNGEAEITVKELREHLEGELPDYMIPAYFVPIDKLQLTASGKIDRKALPDPQAMTRETETEYIAPANAVEEKLVEVWEKVLGREKVGIRDNFFQEGGDSIKTIQIVSRLNEAGYKLEMRDIFQYPTIAELAPRIKKSERARNRHHVTGDVQLTPIQHWYNEKRYAAPHHYNQAVMLKSEEGFSEEMVRAVFVKIQEHHDVLRMTVTQQNGRPRQTIRGIDAPLSLQEYDITNREAPAEAVTAEARKIQAGIDLENGPLMKLGLFHLNDGDRLLIVIHHHVIDAVSWRILFEDIETLAQQYKNGQTLELPYKTDSYKRWAEAQVEYADSPGFQAEKAYWSKQESSMGLDVHHHIEADTPDGTNNVEDTERHTFTLTPEETGQLQGKVNEAYNTEINDILLAALGAATKKTYGRNRLLLAQEGHGREEINDTVDITRTVGWFTTIYPVILDVSHTGDQARHLKEIKETLRRVPNKGIGYGILKYLTAEEHKKDVYFRLNPRISFNYLGQFDADVQNRTFGIAEESAGNTQAKKNRRAFEIDIQGMIQDKRLTMSISYSKKRYKPETIAQLADSYKEELKNIISFCAAQQRKALTPSDLTYPKLSVDALDRLQEKEALEDIYTLSPLQEGMLFHALTDTTDAYFVQVSYRLRGRLDTEAVRQSLNRLMARYDILRTAFITEGFDRPLQAVVRDRREEFQYRDIRGESDKEAIIRQYKEDDRRRSFDIRNDTLMRVAIHQPADDEYEFIWSHQHILMDGWCTGILIAEFFEIYHGILRGETPQLTPVKPYKTYIRWLEARDQKASGTHWANYLEGYEEAATIPRQNPSNDKNKEYRKQETSFTFDRETGDALKKLAAKNQVTLNTLIQAAWGIIVGKYSGKRDVVFGAVVSGRPAEIEGVEKMVGLFINTIPVRIRWEDGTTFERLLQTVQQEAIDNDPHHYYPLAEIQTRSPLKRNLLDHLMVFENYPIAQQLAGAAGEQNEENENNLEISGIDRFEQTNYDFNVMVFPNERVTVRFEYNTEEYREENVEQIGRHLEQQLRQVLTNPARRVDDYDIVSEAEKQQIRYGFNDTRQEYPKDITIHQQFEAQVEKTPDHTALEGKDPRTGDHRRLTYRELNDDADKVAARLRQRGVGPETVVGITAERSIEMVVGIYGILKAGGAYLPIDPETPQERIDYMIKDSSAIHNITGEEIRGIMEQETEPADTAGTTPPPHTSAQLCYVIYTSGTTGRPKGVMIEHRAVVNRLNWMQREYPIGEGDKILQKTPVTFDVSVWELFWWAQQGASLYQLAPGEEKDPAAMVKAIRKHNITTMHFVPTMLNAFQQYIEETDAAAEAVSSLRQVFSSGEALKKHQVEAFNRHQGTPNETVLINLYGPTEATVDVSHYKCTPGETINAVPIGKPIDNIRLYVLDKNRRHQPIGAAGELCIAGDGLARGYLNRPELTAEKFVENKASGEIGDRIYRTGDLARWRSDGNIEYQGRMDYQVKIRGQRIELEEIEAHLLKHEDIKEAVVQLKEAPAAGNHPGESGEPHIYAYMVSPKEQNVTQLRTHLSKTLPAYMIPSYFIQVDRIPLTPSGKVDRRALNANDAKLGTGVEYVEPKNDLEKMIAGIWKEVLHVDKVGLDDNFFDLGGNSLKAIPLIGKLNAALKMDIPPTVLFDKVTVGMMVEYLSKQGKENEEAAPIEETDRPAARDRARRTRQDQRARRKNVERVDIPEEE